MWGRLPRSGSTDSQQQTPVRALAQLRVRPRPCPQPLGPHLAPVPHRADRLVVQVKGRCDVVVITHHLQQAAELLSTMQREPHLRSSSSRGRGHGGCASTCSLVPAVSNA